MHQVKISKHMRDILGYSKSDSKLESQEEAVQFIKQN